MGKLFSGGCAEASNFLVAGVPGQGGTLDNHFLDGKAIGDDAEVLSSMLDWHQIVWK